MPDPVWTTQYNVSQTPENNGFARVVKGSPVVNDVRTGPTANRRVDVDSTNGDVIFETTSSPILNSTVGATMEVTINVSGPSEASHAGCELTFSNRAVIIQVHPNSCCVVIDGINGTGQEHIISTAANNSNIVWRAVYDGPTNQFRLYRAGSLVAGPYTLSTTTKPSSRILWWVESGAIASWKAIKWYLGGGVQPG